MAGRPSKFKPEYVALAENYCILGATDVEVAGFLGVGLRTLADWKNAHPEFADAMNTGKEAADAKVVGALYRGALAGNTTAQIFWLKNRKRTEWRDRVETEHSGEVGLTVNVVKFSDADSNPS